jgi:hypothetical protein
LVTPIPQKLPSRSALEKTDRHGFDPRSTVATRRENGQPFPGLKSWPKLSQGGRFGE